MRGATNLHVFDVHGQYFFERFREWNNSVFGTLGLFNAYLAALKINIGKLNVNKFIDASACIQERFDDQQVLGVLAGPDRFIVFLEFILGRNVR